MQFLLNDSTATVRQDADKMFSLTDLWRLAGSQTDKAPAQWLRHDDAVAFVKASARFLKCVPETLFRSTKGRTGGTWAVEQIALEYAQYLSPELAVLVNQAFIERIEEEANPELAIQRGTDRAVKGWKKQGKSDKWIEARINGVATRKAFTSALAAHGVKQNGYRNCTNAIYTPLYGGTTEVVRHKKGLSTGASIRDSMTSLELAAVNLAEHMAQATIESGNLRGNASCEMACTKASRHVAKALLDNQRSASEIR